MLNVKLTCF